MTGFPLRSQLLTINIGWDVGVRELLYPPLTLPCLIFSLYSSLKKFKCNYEDDALEGNILNGREVREEGCKFIF